MSARRELFSALDVFEDGLPEPGDFLVGDSLSAADTAAAALLSPLIAPSVGLRIVCKTGFRSRRGSYRTKYRSVRRSCGRALYEAHRGSSMAENSEIEGSGFLMWVPLLMCGSAPKSQRYEGI